MPRKKDADTTGWVKLLQLFRRFLVDGKQHYQSDLARDFNCSPQSIMRMTDAIEKVMGVNFESGKDGRRKWYRLASKNSKCLGLDFEELRYLSICREMAGHVLPPKIVSRIGETIFDLSVLMLNPSYADRVKKGTKDFALFHKGRIDYSQHSVTIDSLIAATEQHWVCRLSYQSPKDATPVPHLFVPTKMVSMNQALYVLGATVEPDFKTVRYFLTLAVHRIRSITLTNRSCLIDFPVAESGFFGLPWHEPRQYKIHFVAGGPANYVRERIWSDEQSIDEQLDGSIILSLTSQSEPELYSWVNSFGEGAKVLNENLDES